MKKRDIPFVHFKNLLMACIVLVIAGGCVSTKYVPENRQLLDKVSIQIEDKQRNINTDQLSSYLKNQPNQTIFWMSKFRLGLYNLSGRDSTKFLNNILRRMGEPPVLFDSLSVVQDSEQLRRSLVNAGYRNARVNTLFKRSGKGKKMKVTHSISLGTPHIVRNISYRFPNDTIREMVMADSSQFVINSGELFDLTLLARQREIINSNLRNKGYYAFGNNLITFTADTAAGDRLVDLTMTIQPPVENETQTLQFDTHRRYLIRRIKVIANYNPQISDRVGHYEREDSVRYRDLTIYYGENKYLTPSTIYENCFLKAGEPYSTRATDNTYSSYGRLSIISLVNIRFVPVESNGPDGLMDAYILLTPGKSQTVAAEVEGTNTGGDFGVALGLTYTHRNLFRGSETYSVKVRGSYEAITGKIIDLIRNRNLEGGSEMSLLFPQFKFPFLSENFRKGIKASTEIGTSINYQERPEYSRIIATLGFNYKWMDRSGKTGHTFTPFDLNYVYLPESTQGFIDHIAPNNPLLRYSYEDHAIMRLGYGYHHTNKQPGISWYRSALTRQYAVRMTAEIAGNALFAINRLTEPSHDFHTEPYRVFGIPFAQYAKGDVDFSYLRVIDSRNCLAFHGGFGIGIPYGNSTILPFEKRFYGGGANGVRGWQVRTLGPGSYNGSNSVSNFIYQCGDIRLDLSLEYRCRAFWKLEPALFVDAGNIWTIRNYTDQPGGEFRFNSFYKEIAVAYGVGARLDLDIMLIRCDLGMKAHNPAKDAYRWPILRPSWGRDASLHISIGYPF